MFLPNDSVKPNGHQWLLLGPPGGLLSNLLLTLHFPKPLCKSCKIPVAVSPGLHKYFIVLKYFLFLPRKDLSSPSDLMLLSLS